MERAEAEGGDGDRDGGAEEGEGTPDGKGRGGGAGGEEGRQDEGERVEDGAGRGGGRGIGSDDADEGEADPCERYGGGEGDGGAEGAASALAGTPQDGDDACADDGRYDCEGGCGHREGHPGERVLVRRSPQRAAEEREDDHEPREP